MFFISDTDTGAKKRQISPRAAMSDAIRPNGRKSSEAGERNRLTGGVTEEAPFLLTNGGSMEPLSESNSDEINEANADSQSAQ